MTFQNRRDAAERLAARLASFSSEHPLVLGIPRGGVPLARVVADRLGADLDVVLVHKLRAPDQPEFAIGAIDEAGHVYLTEYGRDKGVARRYLEAEEREQLEALKARRRLYTPVHAPRDVAGRTVIIVDDGIATGATVVAAIHSMRRQKAARVIVATPVAPSEAVEQLETLADEVVCLSTPRPFFAIGSFYDDFGPVSDEEVTEALRGDHEAAATTTAR